MPMKKAPKLSKPEMVRKIVKSMGTGVSVAQVHDRYYQLHHGYVCNTTVAKAIAEHQASKAKAKVRKRAKAKKRLP